MLTIENNLSTNQQTIKLSGALSGIDALQFRDKIKTIIEIKDGQLHLDVSQVSRIDLTGFNSVVMLKKEALKRRMTLLVISDTGNPLHKYIHLSKLSFNCINRSSI